MDTTEVEAPAQKKLRYTSQESGRSTKINWVEAKEYYLSDPKISYNQVAEKFGTTYKSVQKWSAREGWINQRKNNAAEQGLEVPNEHINETPEQINERHIGLYLQMQGFIKTNVAVSQDYVREQYLEAKRKGKATGKKEMFSAQNVKYLMEALKIAVDGERIAHQMNITGPTKSEKDIKVSATMAKYEPSQIEAMFAETKSIIANQREFIEADSGQ